MLLQAISHSHLIPAEQTEELLEIPGRFADGVGHGLDTFSGQVTQLAFDVEVEIATGCDPAEAVIKLVQKSSQFRFDSHNCFGIHVDNLLNNDCSQEYHRLAT